MIGKEKVECETDLSQIWTNRTTFIPEVFCDLDVDTSQNIGTPVLSNNR